jgi:hypothetical protein
VGHVQLPLRQRVSPPLCWWRLGTPVQLNPRYLRT